MAKYSSILVLTAAALAACDAPAPRIVELSAAGETRDVAGPYRVLALTRGSVDRARVEWRVDEIAQPAVAMRDDGAGRWVGLLPGRPPGVEIEYRVTVDGPGGRDQAPRSSFASFRVLDPTEACLVDGDCLVDEICDRIRRRCKTPPDGPCDSDGDCPQDTVCVDGDCRFRPTTCTRDAQCQSGLVCEDGRCVAAPMCRDDVDCGPGGRCLTPPGRCATTDACMRDADCGTNAVCRAGRCQPALPPVCEPPCPRGERCDSGVCVPEAPCGEGCEMGLICDLDRGVCVACTADGHCGPDAHCDVETQTCRPGARGRPCVPCGRDGACGPDLLCAVDFFYTCLPTCGRDRSCPQGFDCDGGRCAPNQFCEGTGCRDDANCDSGVCQSGVCEPVQRCSSAPDCAGDRRCDRGRCVPLAAVCRDPEDCPRGQICLAGRCVDGQPLGVCEPCREAADCPSPAYCGDSSGDGQSECLTLCGIDGCPNNLVCAQTGTGINLCVDASDGICAEPAACEPDRFEPNDDFAIATEIGVGESFGGATLCAGDADAWVVFADVPSLFRVTPSGRVRYDAFDRDGGELAAGVVDAGEATPIALPPGGGWVVLAAAGGGELGYNVAVIRSDLPMECDDDILEENDTPETATRIGNGAEISGWACPGDLDFFELRVREGQSGWVRVISREPGLRYVLARGNGAVVSAAEIDQVVGLVTPWFEDGLRLELECPGCSVAYSIGTAFRERPPCMPDALEPNDDRARATPIEAPFVAEGLNLCGSTDDWYVFEHVRDRRSTIEIEFDGRSADIDVAVLDEAGVVWGRSLSPGDNESVTLDADVPSGRYFARFYLWTGDESTPYELRLRQR